VKVSHLHSNHSASRRTHDLRHTGNLFIADAGANLRELMERMGHSSSRAALIYLHSTSDRQRTLADAVADRARTELDASSCGTNWHGA
jgi:integrase